MSATLGEELADDLGPGGGTVRIDLTSVTRVRPGAERIRIERQWVRPRPS